MKPLSDVYETLDRIEINNFVDVSAASSLEFLRSVYCNPSQPMPRRLRAAIAALPFEHPKLSVTASVDGNLGFAAKLEAAIVRSREGTRYICVSK